jgi:ABC-type uncharacterized transport system substrate-binding protein
MTIYVGSIVPNSERRIRYFPRFATSARRGRVEHYAELAGELVRSNPDLIFTLAARLVQDFKAATTVIPIVAYTSDPIVNGLATSLPRPGGNVTGVVAMLERSSGPSSLNC